MERRSLKFLKINSIWLIAGIILLILGYSILQISGEGKTWEQQVFAWHKLTLAPIILISGYVSIGLSILIPAKK
jgi:hypothetical protein